MLCASGIQRYSALRPCECGGRSHPLTPTVRKLRDTLVRLGALLLNIGVLAATPLHADQTGRQSITVFAAASLKTALDEAAAAYTRAAGTRTVISYAASPALAKQIEQQAPADVFISADLDWMDDLAGKKLIRDETRKNLLGNRLVLIAPASSAVTLRIEPGFDLRPALGEGRLAVAHTATVPAGKYAKASLETLGVWSSVADRLAEAQNVRAALALVALGEAPLGIVYRTDALSESKVKIVGELPGDTHPPVVYPIAVTANSTKPEAANAFIAFLRSQDGAEIFTRQGFTTLP